MAEVNLAEIKFGGNRQTAKFSGYTVYIDSTGASEGEFCSTQAVRIDKID